MSEETKKAPEAEAGTPEPDKVQDGSAETAAEQPASPGAGSGEAAAAPEAEAAKDEPKKKDGWFNKKNREAEALKAKLDAAEKNAAQLKDQLLRVAAEYDNYRKRTSREADQKFNDGVSYAVGQIIPILDTLEMAANAPCADENYKKGVTMTLENSRCPPRKGRRAAPSSPSTRRATSWATRSSATPPWWWPNSPPRISQAISRNTLRLYHTPNPHRALREEPLL